MLAIIMAGGEGARLRPLTCDRPKPMAPLAGKPVMEYALALLKAHGVRRAAATLKYLPDSIRTYFGSGADFGLELNYYTETEPLGTAGGVAQARDFLTETFCVLSGDGLTDCDLTAALASHRASGAEATIVLSRVENPLEYGLVRLNGDGSVARFLEKPEWSQVTSDLANTGIYIFEPSILSRIPSGESYDFGQQLFPEMLRQGARIHTYLWEGYWCDIGDLAAYRQANLDLLSGKVALPGIPRLGGVTRMPGARVDPTASLEAPCLIGENASVAAHAKIGAGTVLGPGASVGEWASVKQSVLWESARLDPRCELRGGVIMNSARMEADSRAFEGSVLGADSVLGQRATLAPAARVWPGKRLAADTRFSGSLVWGGGETASFQEGAFYPETPQEAAALARAWCAALSPDSVILSRDASAASQACFLAAQAALLSQGVQVYDAGRATLPETRLALWSFGANGAAHVSYEQGVRLWDGQGAELSGGQRRAVLARLRRGDGERPFTRLMRPPVSAGRCNLLYLGQAAQEVGSLSGCCAAVYCADPQLLNLAERAFEKVGCRVRAEWEEEMMEIAPGETGVWLENGGESVRFLSENGMLTEAENQLMILWTRLMDGCRRLTVPQRFTHACEELAARFGGEVNRACGERAQLMATLLEAGRDSFLCHFDGIFLALRALSHLQSAGLTLDKWRGDMPRIHRRSRVVRLEPSRRTRAIKDLLSSPEGERLDDALSRGDEHGWAWVCPSDSRGECRVITESYRAETAAELCDIYCRALGAPPAAKS